MRRQRSEMIMMSDVQILSPNTPSTTTIPSITSSSPSNTNSNIHRRRHRGDSSSHMNHHNQNIIYIQQPHSQPQSTATVMDCCNITDKKDSVISSSSSSPSVVTISVDSTTCTNVTTTATTNTTTSTTTTTKNNNNNDTSRYDKNSRSSCSRMEICKLLDNDDSDNNNNNNTIHESTTASCNYDFNTTMMDQTMETTMIENISCHDVPSLHQLISNYSMETMIDPECIPIVEEQIRTIIQNQPELVIMHHNQYKGKTPFHMACEMGVSFQIIVDLYHANPTAISVWTQPSSTKKSNTTKKIKKVKSYTNMLPLHVACRYDSNIPTTQYEIISFLLQTYPEASKCTTTTTTTILSSSKTTTTTTNSTTSHTPHNYHELLTGDLPLHLYCQNHFCNIPVLIKIIKSYPLAIKLQNHQGKLPLHLACERRYYQRMDHTTKSKHPKKYNNNNNTNQQSTKLGITSSTSKMKMIHSNSNSSTPGSDEIIRCLISAYPDSLLIYDENGDIPLHAAIRGYQNISTIEYMLSMRSQSIYHVDNFGRNIIHKCIMNTITDLSILSTLLKYDTITTNEKDTSTHTYGGGVGGCCNQMDHKGYIPLQYATEHKSINIIYTLLRHSPSSLDLLRN